MENVQAIKKRKGRAQLSPSLILVISIIFGLGFFLMEAILDYIFFETGKGNFMDRLIYDVSAHSVFTRVSVLTACIIAGALIGQYIKKIQEGRSELERILDSSPDTIIRVDPSYGIIWANSSAIRKHPNLDGEKCYVTFAGRDEPCEGCPGIEALKTGNVEVGFLHRKKNEHNQEESHWENISIPLKDKQGEIESLIQISRDITDRTKFENEILSLSKFPAENPNPVMRLNEMGIILVANRASDSILKHWATKLGGSPPQSIKDMVIECINAGKSRTFEIELEETIYSFTFAPIQDQGYVNIYGIDMTSRVKVEREKARLIRELEARNEELEQYAYSISHDLKTPLITMGGFLGMVNEDLETGDIEKAKDDMARVARAIEKMDQLMNNLLDVSRMGLVLAPFTQIQMEKLLKEAIELNNGRISSRKVEIQIAPNFPTITGNKTKLLEVWLNLIDNGVKFMGDQPHPELNIGFDEKEEEYIFHIRDNGIGIEPQFHEKIFKLFDKLDNSKEGSGVGLALVRRIIGKHGGRIWVESEGKDKGCTFRFSIPKERKRRA